MLASQIVHPSLIRVRGCANQGQPFRLVVRPATDPFVENEAVISGLFRDDEANLHLTRIRLTAAVEIDIQVRVL